MADGATADVRFGNLVHADRGLHSCRLATVLQRVLEGQGIDDGAEHAHVIGRDAVHAALARRVAADDVATADHDRELGVVFGLHRDDVHSDVVDDIGIDAEGRFAGESLASQLEEHPIVARQSRRLDHCMTWLD